MQETMRAAGALLLAAACTAAQSQTIYRCGNTYGPQPCADGKALDGAPPPSTADRSLAAANAKRDAQLADAMQKDRARREGQAGNTFYVPPPAFEPDRPADHKWPDKAGTRKLDVFTATVPGTIKPKKAAADKKDTKQAQHPAKGKAPTSVQAAAPAKGS